jgi:hypothetical protein
MLRVMDPAAALDDAELQGEETFFASKMPARKRHISLMP